MTVAEIFKWLVIAAGAFVIYMILSGAGILP